MVKIGDLLESKFYEFTTEVKCVVPEAEKIMSDLGGVNKVDYIEVMDAILFLFPDDRTLYHLDQLLDLKGINIPNTQKELLIPLVEKYVAFLVKVKAHIGTN